MHINMAPGAPLCDQSRQGTNMTNVYTIHAYIHIHFICKSIFIRVYKVYAYTYAARMHMSMKPGAPLCAQFNREINITNVYTQEY